MIPSWPSLESCHLRDADQWADYFGSTRPDGWWALYPYAEGIPVWLQELDAGLKSRVLKTITEPTWHTLGRDLSKFSDIMALLEGKLGQNLVQTRRQLYRMTFGKSYEELVALGRPLQELSALFRERVQMYRMMPREEFVVYGCLEFMESRALPYEKNNQLRTEALRRVVRKAIKALETRVPMESVIPLICEALDEEDRLAASEAPPPKPSPHAKLAEVQEEQLTSAEKKQKR